ncbi:Hypothetical predicted protein [Cloeon dipterum]|uniref:Uncharacterized protein n=1 Tax=Cloeon dipterum TaxID=197152 RepID=A0A8S1CYT5_9INSE|nr:Hypothetical predicted protein [Cloeon dipterum]
MDPALKKLLEAVSIKGQSEENLDQCYDLVASKEIPFEDFLPFLRALAARVQSSKTFDVLSKLLNRGFYGFLTGMNLEEFSNLYPLEEGFLLNVLRLFTDRKYAISIHALNIYVTEGMAECTSPRCEEMEETSQLENLQLNPLHLDLVAFNADKFPNVVSLTLDWRKILYGTQLSNLKWSSSLKQFPKLNDLKNFGLNSRVYLTYILDILGPNLRILHFEYGLKIDFKDIHQHCPNLEKLEIVGNSVDDSNSIEYFDSLHDLRIKFSSDSSKELNLTNLLAAPNIKTVKLSGFQVNKHEMKKTIVMIKNEQILTQVETLTLTLDGRMPAKTKRAIQSEYNRFFIAVQNGQQRDFSFKLDFTEDIQRC